VTNLSAANSKLCHDVNFTVTANPSMTDVRLRSPVAHFGEFSLDSQRMELCRADHPIGLTLLEFKVLKFLVSRPRIVASRQRLISSAWPKRKRASYRAVDNCIAALRQKIENHPDCPVLIRTVRGVGYKFVPQETERSLPESLAEHISEGT
jgi:DNA-binding response OmpR family regulator